MLKDGNGVLMWVQPNTRQAIKQFGQATGESQHEVTARLVEQERRRLARQEKKGGMGR